MSDEKPQKGEGRLKDDASSAGPEDEDGQSAGAHENDDDVDVGANDAPHDYDPDYDVNMYYPDEEDAINHPSSRNINGGFSLAAIAPSVHHHGAPQAAGSFLMATGAASQPYLAQLQAAQAQAAPNLGYLLLNQQSSGSATVGLPQSLSSQATFGQNLAGYSPAAVPQLSLFGLQLQQLPALQSAHQAAASAPLFAAAASAQANQNAHAQQLATLLQQLSTSLLGNVAQVQPQNQANGINAQLLGSVLSNQLAGSAQPSYVAAPGMLGSTADQVALINQALGTMPNRNAAATNQAQLQPSQAAALLLSQQLAANPPAAPSAASLNANAEAAHVPAVAAAAAVPAAVNQAPLAERPPPSNYQEQQWMMRFEELRTFREVGLRVCPHESSNIEYLYLINPLASYKRPTVTPGYLTALKRTRS